MAHPFFDLVTQEDTREQQRVAYEAQVDANRQAATTALATQRADLASKCAARIGSATILVDMALTPSELAVLGDLLATGLERIHRARLVAARAG